MFARLYQNTVLENPKLILALLILILLFFGYNTKNFKLDASSDTLILENDPDLEYLQEISSRYGAKDFLILTYTPNEKITSDNAINNSINDKIGINDSIIIGNNSFLNGNPTNIITVGNNIFNNNNDISIDYYLLNPIIIGNDIEYNSNYKLNIDNCIFKTLDNNIIIGNNSNKVIINNLSYNDLIDKPNILETNYYIGVYIKKDILTKNRSSLIPEHIPSRKLNEKKFWFDGNILLKKFNYYDDQLFNMFKFQLISKMRHTINLDIIKLKKDKINLQDYIDD